MTVTAETSFHIALVNIPRPEALKFAVEQPRRAFYHCIFTETSATASWLQILSAWIILSLVEFSGYMALVMDISQ
jgi:hypothetical protein